MKTSENYEIKLFCNGKMNFVGCDTDDITLTVPTKGAELKKYRAVFSSTKRYLQEGIYDLWDIELAQGVREFAYRGKPLGERKRVYWKIIFNKGTSESEPAFFETGIRSFQGRWIGYGEDTGGHTLLFKREFDCDEAIGEARLYLCGLGFFRAKFNGVDLDEKYFKPLFTDYTERELSRYKYRKKGSYRVTYYTYDVAQILRAKDNILEIEVGDGWFGNSDKIIENLKFGESALCFDVYIDGRFILGSDQDTQVCKTNKISTLYKGDSIDFTSEDSEFIGAVCREPPTGKLTAPRTEDDESEKKIEPLLLKKDDLSQLYDFCENHSGTLSFRVRGNRGSVLKCEFFEIFNKDGTPNASSCAYEDEASNQTILQENRYILSGGTDTVEPLFSWKGYRYVKISSDSPFEIFDLQSLYIHTKLTETGEFSCSEQIFNDLFDKYRRTQKNNMHTGIPSDCPHREKLPYTGDGQLCAEAAMYCFDAESFYAKWLDDIIDSQAETGYIPHTAPMMGGGGGYNWGNALFIVAEQLYRFTGNLEYLRKIEAPLQKWLDYYRTVLNANGVVCKNGQNWFLGDWLKPDDVRFNVLFMSTMCYYNAVAAMCDLKRRLREPNDSYVLLREQIRRNIIAAFYDEKSGNFCEGVQGENVLPLQYGIVKGMRAKKVLERAKNYYIEERGFRIDTGIVATPVLIEYLTDHGEAELAYRIMTSKGKPSYFNMMDGETTLCECWNKGWPHYCFRDGFVVNDTDCSHDHPMFGSVTAWLFKRAAGLDLSELCKRIIHFKPALISFLEYAKAEKETNYGIAKISWFKENEQKLTVDLSIPPDLKGVAEIAWSGKWRLWKSDRLLGEGECSKKWRQRLNAGQYKIIFES